MSETTLDPDQPLAVPLPAARTAAQAGVAPVSDDPFTLNAVRVLLRRWDELVDVLTRIATRPAVVDELRRSISTLAGASWELSRHRPRALRELAVFLPSNNILYSYVLFGLVPARFAERVVIRPSTRVAEAVREVHRVLSTDPLLADGFPVELAELSQRRFLARYSAADAVVFTGKPENATAVAARLTGDPLVLAFGSGPNPVVVGPEADLASVVADVVRVRTYNSGQDCLCPDVVMVHESVADDFVAELASAVRGLRVGRREEFDVEVAPLVYPDAVRDIADFLAAHRGAVRAGGRVRADLGFVEPTLLDLPWDPAFHPPEFFGPVFAVTRYRDVADVRRWASSPEELRRGMYLSHYGEPALTERVLGTAVTLAEQVTLDEENGNAPLGGYGLEAGHARRGAAVVARPLLLSAELGAAGLGPTASGGGREPR